MFYDQLEYLCEKEGTTPTAFVKDTLGLSTSKITAWKNGSIPKYGILEMISNHFNVSISFLFEDSTTLKSALSDEENELINKYKALSSSDKGRILERIDVLTELAEEKSKKSVDISSKSFKTHKSAKKYIQVAFFPHAASAGTGLYLDETTSEPLNILDTSEAAEADYAIPIAGDSMEPDFSDGDIVLVKSCPYVGVGDIGIFVLNGEAFIKEYDGDSLISHNKKYEPIMLKKYETAVCLGLVLGKAVVAE